MNPTTPARPYHRSHQDTLFSAYLIMPCRKSLISDNCPTAVEEQGRKRKREEKDGKEREKKREPPKRKIKDKSKE